MDFLLFPLALIFTSALTLLHYYRLRGNELWLRRLQATLVCLLLNYLVAFGLICYDPYFDDNGRQTMIEWSERWVWAFAVAGKISLYSLPLLFFLQLVITRRNTAKSSSIASQTHDNSQNERT